VTAARTPASAPAPGVRRKPAPAAEVVRLYWAGLTMGEIAGIFQVSAWVIGSRLEEAGVRRRAPGEQGGLPVDRAVRRYRRQPHLLRELAAGLGIHPQLLVDRAARPAPADRGQGTWRADVRARGLLAEGFKTVALTYIGSELTAPIYREGTIGAAKMDLEATAETITKALDGAGRAWTCVNGAAVTQASTHIPGIALYTAVLRAVLGDALQTPAEQLWDQLTGTAPPGTDDRGRIRLDRWELEPAVQAEVARRWHAATPDTIGDLADTGWFRAQFRALYGFDVAGIDYAAEAETDIPWPGEQTPDEQP
jgi:hypothetical protein